MNTDFVEQLWALIMNNQVSLQFNNLYEMKKALEEQYPNDATAIAQAYQTVQRELVGA